MVHAYHSIFTAYGFWLPNDPRGSYSDFVASWELFLAGGGATKVDTRRSVAWRDHDRAARQKAKESLHYAPVRFTDAQIVVVAEGFANAVRKSGYIVYACSILPCHVHAVVARHRFDIERIVGHLKTEGTMSLVHKRHHPFEGLQRPGGRLVSCWAEKSWNVFLNSDEDIRRAIAYVRNNPIKDGLPAQRWSFEASYEVARTIERPDERAG
ncbi:MAG TPA: hypothetical protein VM008_14570 [Phycisphaerae bacterium]|nr:hypothetical protein [Phycisphaerae bacterium]